MVCPICLTVEGKAEKHPTRDATSIKCLQCGDFLLGGVAAAILKNEPQYDRWKLSAWIRDQQPELVTSQTLEQAKEAAIPNLLRRAEKMLRWLAENFQGGKHFSFEDIGKREAEKNTPDSFVVFVGGNVVASPLVSVGWNRSVDEVRYMLDEVLTAEMCLLKSLGPGKYVISAKGLLHLEGRSSEAATLGFCAMWFDQVVEPLWTDTIRNAVRESGYEPLRIDTKQHNRKIDDEIVASIRASRFVVADFTGQRGGVYYEAGFAHGLGMEVVFTCHKDRMGDLHFDTNHFAHIVWETPKDLREQLYNRVVATVGEIRGAPGRGKGAVDPPAEQLVEGVS